MLIDIQKALKNRQPCSVGQSPDSEDADLGPTSQWGQPPSAVRGSGPGEGSPGDQGPAGDKVRQSHQGPTDPWVPWQRSPEHHGSHIHSGAVYPSPLTRWECSQSRHHLAFLAPAGNTIAKIVSPIVSVVVVTLVGAAASYFQYNRRRNCFRTNGKNVHMPQEQLLKDKK
uniref:Uncharacterized protein n=1 Tax=Sus scrofa TaxID=9823 RepID=A0A8W4F8I5_PIG